MSVDNSGKVKTENTAEEMLEQFETIKTRKENATDIRDLLPPKARLKGGKLFVSDEVNTGKDLAGLTENRRRILKTVHAYPHRVQGFIANKVGTSNTAVSRTITNFGFILNDERLYKYFVLRDKSVLINDSTGEKDHWEVEFDYSSGSKVEEFSTEEQARKAVFHHANVFDEYPTLRNPEGNVVKTRGVLDLVTKNDDWSEKASEGMKIIEETHGDLTSFFEQVTDGSSDHESENSIFEEEELFMMFKLLALQDSEKYDSIARKVASYI